MGGNPVRERSNFEAPRINLSQGQYSHNQMVVQHTGVAHHNVQWDVVQALCTTMTGIKKKYYEGEPKRLLWLPALVEAAQSIKVATGQRLAQTRACHLGVLQDHLMVGELPLGGGVEVTCFEVPRSYSLRAL